MTRRHYLGLWLCGFALLIAEAWVAVAVQTGRMEVWLLTLAFLMGVAGLGLARRR